MVDRRFVLAAGVLCGCPTPLPPPLDQGGSDSTATSVGETTTSGTIGSSSLDTTSPDPTDSGSSDGQGPLPAGQDDEYCLLQGAPADFSSPYSVLDNDDAGTSIDPDNLVVTTVMGGSVTFQADGHFTYTMPAGGVISAGEDCEAIDSCMDSFSYRMRDASGAVSEDIAVTLRMTRLRVDLGDVSRGAGGFVIRGGRQTGVSVAAAGDVNADGVPDILVGSHRADLAKGIGDSGLATVVFGGMSDGVIDLESGAAFAGFSISGGAAQLYSGYGLAGAGDVDEDGYDDVIVSSTGADGTVYVVFGADSEEDLVLPTDGSDTERVFTVVRGGPGSILGAFVDVWHQEVDPQTWLLVSGLRYGPGEEGAAAWRPLPTDRGALSLYDLDDGPFMGAGIVTGTVPAAATMVDAGFEFGGIVRALGPLGGGGVTYVAMASDTRVQDANHIPSPTNSAMRGRVHVVPATPDTTHTMQDVLDGLYGAYIEGDVGDRFGRSIAVAGDLDDDGSPDVAIAAPGRDHGAPETSGMVYVFFDDQLLLSSGGLDAIDRGGDRLLILGDEDDVSDVGYGVGAAGDFNADGIDDLIVGAPSVVQGLLQNCEEVGRAYVIFGGPDLRSRGELRLSDVRNGIGGFAIEQDAHPDATSGCLGWSVASVGDIDGDGASEVIIGAPGLRPAHPNAEYDGGAYVVYGSSPVHPGVCRSR